MIADRTVEALLALGVPAAVLRDLPDIGSEVSGLLVYGSQARGDAVAGSDLDLLALVNRPKPSSHSGDVNVSYYTPAQLSTGASTLFGAHLRRDAKILWDDSGQLASALDTMGEVDAERLFNRARVMSQLFTCQRQDLPKYLPGFLREARYLLRSCLYAQAIAEGRPCFSVRELAVRHEDPALAQLLASRQEGEPEVGALDECLARLRGILGKFPASENGSLEATVVNEWDSPGDLLSMAFMALGVTGIGTDYAEVEKILL